MQFAIFGSAQAGSERPGAALGEGFHDFVEFNVEAEALGYCATFLVEHHFTGWNQVSATLQLLTWLAARTTTLRLGTAVLWPPSDGDRLLILPLRPFPIPTPSGFLARFKVLFAVFTSRASIVGLQR
jgi:hypothetical protein